LFMVIFSSRNICSSFRRPNFAPAIIQNLHRGQIEGMEQINQ
jgi:hypothetical protein